MATGNSTTIRGFVQLSRTIGRNIEFTQGPGGNAAVKSEDGKTMVVKTSGRPMSGMTARSGYRVLNLKKLRNILKTRDAPVADPAARQLRINERVVAATVDGLGGDVTPSLETLLHAQVGRCSIHVHPPNLIGIISSRDGRRVIMELLEEHRPLWLRYANPGFMVAREFQRAVEKYRRKHDAEPNVILMQKHGACFVADTPEQLIRRVREVLRKVDSLFGPRPANHMRRRRSDSARLKYVTTALEEAHRTAFDTRVIVERVNDEHFRRTMASRSHRELILSGALTPEQIAYAGGEPVFLDASRTHGITAELVDVFRRRKTPPAATVVGGAGLFIAASTKPQWEAARDMTLASARSIVVARKFGGPSFLTPGERDYVIRLKGHAVGD